MTLEIKSDQRGPSGESYAGRIKYTDRVADRYRSKSEGRRGPENRILLELLTKHGLKGPLLDSPCGVGRVPDLLQDRDIDYVGADLSPAMLRSAAERLAGFENPKIRTRLAQADAEQLPYGDRSFGTTLSLRFLHHLPALTRAHVMEELARVTEGLVIVTYFHPFALHYLDRQVKRMIRGRWSERYSHTASWLAKIMKNCQFELIDEVGTGLLRETRYAVFRRRS